MFAGAAVHVLGAHLEQRQLGTHPTRWTRAPRPRRVAPAPQRFSAPTPLHSPLTGTACVAYELGIRRDRSGDAAEGPWALLEQRCADLDVAGGTMDGRRVFVALAERRSAPVLLEELDESTRKMLRVRGFDLAHDPLFVFETVIRGPSDARLHLGEGVGGAVLSAIG